MYKWEFSTQAVRDFRKLPQNIRKRIIKKLDYFASCQNPLDFCQHLINSDIGQYRFRIEDYRVVFDLEDEILIILTLGHRKNIYK